MDQPLLMSRAEAAVYLGMSLSHFQRHVQAELPLITLRRYTHVLDGELERALEQLNAAPCTGNPARVPSKG